MKKILYALSILLVFSFYVPAKAQVITPEHLYVIAGQSNAVGASSIYPDPQLTDARVMKWWGEWLLGAEPSHQPPGKFGPATSFGVHLVHLIGDPNYTIGLIPCAVGGSSISSWQRGQPNYENCILKINAALAVSPGATLSGVFFWQGETNTSSTASADTWPLLFRKFVTAIRTDTHTTARVVYAQLGPKPASGHPAWEYLQGLQAAMADDNPTIKMFTTKDLPAQAPPHDLHLAWNGYIVAGNRAANIFYRNFIAP